MTNTQEDQVQAMKQIAEAIESLAKAVSDFTKMEKDKVITLTFDKDEKDA